MKLFGSNKETVTNTVVSYPNDGPNIMQRRKGSNQVLMELMQFYL